MKTYRVVCQVTGWREFTVELDDESLNKDDELDIEGKFDGGYLFIDGKVVTAIINGKEKQAGNIIDEDEDLEYNDFEVTELEE